MSVLIVDDDEWDADDVRAIKRTSDQYAIWKREGDKRIEKLEAALFEIMLAFEHERERIESPTVSGQTWIDRARALLNG